MATEVGRKLAPGPRYEADLVAWAEAQAKALRAGRLNELDLEYLAEEIEDVARREGQAVESHFETLLVHLLKWRYQPEKRSRSWEGTIRVARTKIRNRLHDSPSLRPKLPQLLARAYSVAWIQAGVETGLPENVFASACPFSLDEVTSDWLPEWRERDPRHKGESSYIG